MIWSLPRYRVTQSLPYHVYNNHNSRFDGRTVTASYDRSFMHFVLIGVFLDFQKITTRTQIVDD